MRLLYVPLDPSELELLKAVAIRERRRPQDQAAVMLIQALTAVADDAKGIRSDAHPLGAQSDSRVASVVTA